MRFYALLIFLLVTQITFSQNFDLQAQAIRITNKPDIDGIINESIWDQCQVVKDFQQYEPNHGDNTTNNTEFFFAYDNSYIYIAAKMYDSSPDSILTQLGNRDDGINADWISIQFDTYANQQDAYIFEVTASGVQRDHRSQDWTYDAVWESAVDINDEGWTAEIRIPFTAIRFPKQENQVWGMQIERGIKRYKEKDLWAFVEKGISNYKNHWGVLLGIKNITYLF